MTELILNVELGAGRPWALDDPTVKGEGWTEDTPRDGAPPLSPSQEVGAGARAGALERVFPAGAGGPSGQWAEHVTYSRLWQWSGVTGECLEDEVPVSRWRWWPPFCRSRNWRWQQP